MWAKNARVRALCADTDALITTRAMQGLGASASAIVDEMGSDASTCVTVATFSRTEAPHGHNMVVDKRQVCLPSVVCVGLASYRQPESTRVPPTRCGECVASWGRAAIGLILALH